MLHLNGDISDLLASILRIDVDRTDAGKLRGSQGQSVRQNRAALGPKSGPTGCGIPGKCPFDPKSGDLWVGDVGWEMWELLDRVERGGNYGWSLFEGRQPVRPDGKRGPTPVLPPVVDHPHTEARSITGGRFYYGSRLKDLHGAYIYGDYDTGKIWGLRHDGKKVTWHQRLADSPLKIIDFAEGRDSELYILEHGGSINRLIPNPSAQANDRIPAHAQATGLFASVKDHASAAGVLPYSINAEPWADHATAERFFALPGTPKLGNYQQSSLQDGIVKGGMDLSERHRLRQDDLPGNGARQSRQPSPARDADPPSRRSRLAGVQLCLERRADRRPFSWAGRFRPDLHHRDAAEPTGENVGRPGTSQGVPNV